MLKNWASQTCWCLLSGSTPCKNCSWVVCESHYCIGIGPDGKAPSDEICRHSSWSFESLQVFSWFFAPFFSSFFYVQPYAEDVLHNILLQSIHHHETDRKQVRSWRAWTSACAQWIKKTQVEHLCFRWLFFKIKFEFQWSNFSSQ